jgi:hypothetical protein
VGTYLLARRLSCRPVAAFVAAIAFSYTGFMNGQIVHIGLVQGTAPLPFLLVAIDGLARQGSAAAGRRTRTATAGYVVLTGVSAALVVLAGDPRAVTTAIVVSVLFLLACLWRARRGAGRIIALALVSAVLGAALSAVQWLPGFGFLQASQRGAGLYSQYGNGSIPLGQLGQLLLLPYALGGNNRIGLARYQGPSNLAELSVGVGLLALVAFVAYLPEVLSPLASWRRWAGRTHGARRPLHLVASTRAGSEDWAAGDAHVADYWAGYERAARRPSQRRLGLWYAVAAIGALLAAGTSIPLGGVLSHVPLYNGERLPGRNVAMLDLALCLLLGFLVDDVVSRRPSPLRRWRSKALALVPLAAAAALALGARVAPTVVLPWFGVAPLSTIPAGQDFLPRQDVYFAVMIGLATLLAGFVMVAHRRAGRRLLAVAIALDLGVAVAGASFITVPSSILVSSTPQASAVAAFAGTGGRYALYNAYIRSILDQPPYLTNSGLTDLNVLRDLPSVQGYGSVVSGTYDHATGTHGLETFNPLRLADGTFDRLNMKVLLTMPLYLGEPIKVHADIPVAGGPPAPANGGPGVGVNAPDPAPLASGPWPIAPGGTRVFRLPGTRKVLRAIVVVDPVTGPPPDRIAVGLSPGTGRAAAGPTHDVRVVNRQAVYFLPNPTLGEMVVVHNPTSRPVVVGAVLAVTSHPDLRLLLDGALQGDLAAGHWSYAGKIGPVLAFENEKAAGPAWLQPAGSTTVDPSRAAAGTVQVDPGSATQPERDVVRAPAPVTLVRSETYEPGWTATLTPLGGGPARTESARPLGIVQSIEVPAGSWAISWRYAPATLREGALLSLAAGLLVLMLVAWLVADRLRARGA